MPGIVGLITKMPKARAEAQIQQMVAASCHESSYVTGTWADQALGVYVGWVARKGSFSDGMPLRNEQGDSVLVFSGEDYPDPGARQGLKQRGHHVDPQGPSYLIHHYEEDPQFPAGLNGRFHGLVADQRRGTAMLFNDRYGLQRIYYHEAREGFYFAAEAKAILAVRSELRKLDLRGLGEFISCGCVLENRSLFEGVHVLPCASVWTFRNGCVERRSTYFQPSEWETQPQLQPEAYYQELREVFSQRLPRYFESREPLAMSLTGGLDTRMILAWQKPPAGSLPCYTFAGMFRDAQDVRVARQVASTCRQSHQLVRADGEFLSRFPKYAERAVYLTDGCVDVSRSVDLYINEVARNIAPVRMTGNYGGEVLRRVRAFKPVRPLPDLFHAELNSQVRQTEATYAEILQTHPLSFTTFRQAPWHHYGLLALEQSQLALRSPYLDNEFVRTVFRAPDSACTSNDVCLRLIADGDAALRRIRTDRGLGGNHGRLAAAVARGFQEFTFKAEYAYDYGMPQWMARIDHLAAPFHLERLFLGRHKFYHFRVWYRDALSRYVREMLLDPRTLSRPFLHRGTLEAIVQGHLKGDRNYTSEIHKVLTLEFIHRLFLDQGVSPN